MDQKYYITYNPDDSIIWGSGTSLRKSAKDAADNLNHYLTNKPAGKGKAYNEEAELKTIECSYDLYTTLNREGYHPELNWFIYGEKALGVPETNEIIEFLSKNCGTLTTIDKFTDERYTWKFDSCDTIFKDRYIACLIAKALEFYENKLLRVARV